MDYGLSGKAAFVGGSSKGIGKAIAYALRREGCQVMISSRDEANLQQASQEIRAGLGGDEVAPAQVEGGFAHLRHDPGG